MPNHVSSDSDKWNWKNVVLWEGNWKISFFKSDDINRSM